MPFVKGHITWNKGLTKKLDERVMKISEKRISRVSLMCNSCGKDYWVSNYRSHTSKFCSYQCYWRDKKKYVGEKCRFFRGGVFNQSSGYLARSEGKKQILIHRDIMSKYLGRPLRQDEIVHHKDGNKKNNLIGNLEIMSRSEHLKHHRVLNLGLVAE